jgi:hypothetical protein
MTPRRARQRPSLLWWLIIAPVAIIASVSVAWVVSNVYDLTR